ncbi:response regulator transcription factor [Ramlibacter tataouinensis]|uniref:helix-turn-helix transcriptional regulator n=1 Tax=Ramlibacter tataouinensis TaxID=94132 RepID=UPI003F80BD67
MSHLTRNDYSTALSLLIDLERASGELPRLMAASVERLPALVACETVRLETGPEPEDGTAAAGQRQREGGWFALCLPLAAAGSRGARLVLRRRSAPFTPRERERLALLQPHLAWLFAQARRQGSRVLPRIAAQSERPLLLRPIHASRLTPREGDVMRWLSCGKTDADIAALLAISPRTVHKHLEHIYEKLGVETRTAAVMAVRRAGATAESSR